MNKGRTVTIIEILIVISVLAMIALKFIPNFINVDSEANVIATRNNLDTIRTQVDLFYKKEGRYPSSLGELKTQTYLEGTQARSYLEKIPFEFISNKLGSDDYDDKPSSIEPKFLGDGGWVYFTDKAQVHIDWDKELDKSWGEYAGKKPSEW